MSKRGPLDPRGREARDTGSSEDPASTYLLRGWSNRRVAALLIAWVLAILAWPAYIVAQAVGFVP